MSARPKPFALKRLEGDGMETVPCWDGGMPVGKPFLCKLGFHKRPDVDYNVGVECARPRCDHEFPPPTSGVLTMRPVSVVPDSPVGGLQPEDWYAFDKEDEMPDETLTVEEAQARVAKAEQRAERCREALDAANAADDDAQGELRQAKRALAAANREGIEKAKEAS